jgi:hypothetical protein
MIERDKNTALEIATKEGLGQEQVSEVAHRYLYINLSKPDFAI